MRRRRAPRHARHPRAAGHGGPAGGHTPRRPPHTPPCPLRQTGAAPAQGLGPGHPRLHPPAASQPHPPPPLGALLLHPHAAGSHAAVVQRVPCQRSCHGGPPCPPHPPPPLAHSHPAEQGAPVLARCGGFRGGGSPLHLRPGCACRLPHSKGQAVASAPAGGGLHVRDAAGGGPVRPLALPHSWEVFRSQACCLQAGDSGTWGHSQDQGPLHLPRGQHALLPGEAVRRATACCCRPAPCLPMGAAQVAVGGRRLRGCCCEGGAGGAGHAQEVQAHASHASQMRCVRAPQHLLMTQGPWAHVQLSQCQLQDPALLCWAPPQASLGGAQCPPCCRWHARPAAAHRAWEGLGLCHGKPCGVEHQAHGLQHAGHLS